MPLIRTTLPGAPCAGNVVVRLIATTARNAGNHFPRVCMSGPACRGCCHLIDDASGGFCCIPCRAVRSPTCRPTPGPHGQVAVGGDAEGLRAFTEHRRPVFRGE